jgi:hypothetical protein
VLTPSARDGLKGSPLGGALRWQPRTQLGVWVVALTCGAIWFAVQLANTVWSLSTRVVLAAPTTVLLAVLGVVTGSIRLRRRLHDQQWSTSHPTGLSPPAGSTGPDSYFSAPDAHHRP